MNIAIVDAEANLVAFARMDGAWHSLMEIACAGGSIGSPGLHVAADPGAQEAAGNPRNLSIGFRRRAQGLR